MKVKSSMQVQGYSRIYAMGDLIEWKEQKQIMKTYGHAAAIGVNILEAVEGRKAKKEYGGSSEMISISIGPVSEAIAYYLGTGLTNSGTSLEGWCLVSRCFVGNTTGWLVNLFGQEWRLTH